MRARDTTKSKKYPKYLGEFVSDLQIDLARSLTKSGSCTKKGKFKITQQVEKYLTRKFKITKRMKVTDILDKLELDKNIINGLLDTEPAAITKFKIRKGNKSICNYTTLKLVPLKKSYTLNPIFHWEFIRVVQMKEDQEETNARHEKMAKECRGVAIKNFKKK